MSFTHQSIPEEATHELPSYITVDTFVKTVKLNETLQQKLSDLEQQNLKLRKDALKEVS